MIKCKANYLNESCTSYLQNGRNCNFLAALDFPCMYYISAILCAAGWEVKDPWDNKFEENLTYFKPVTLNTGIFERGFGKIRAGVSWGMGSEDPGRIKVSR